METKICSKCGRELPLDDFHWRNKAKGTRRSECKECHNQSVKNRYNKNKEILNEIKRNKQCEKCGETRFYVLDYHHIDPKIKKDSVAKLSTHYNISASLKEIEKCVLLCANCHREFHYLEKINGITLQDFLQK